MKTVGKFALWGAIGFGIGGAIHGLGSELLVVSGKGTWFVYGGLEIMGASGGASLGLALDNQSWKMAWRLSLAGAIGLASGWIVASYLAWDLQLVWVGYLVWGAILGASFGVAMWSWKKVGFLALAGAVGFVVVLLIQWGLSGLIPIETYSANNIVRSTMGGIISGVSLGAALGYMEKRKAE